MTFNDIFKSDFLDQATTFSVTDTLIGLAVSLVVGLFIFMVYRKSCSGITYSASFGLTLIGLSLVTTLVIMAVTSNIILSLGMVGALSIVRFRAAIKEPIEIVFLFWAIATGIVVGAGLIPLALIGAVIIGIVLFFLASRKTHENPYILVLHMDDENAEKSAMEMIKAGTKKYAVKAKTVTAAGIELSCEVRLKDGETAFVNKISEAAGIDSASLVSFNGEYMA